MTSKVEQVQVHLLSYISIYGTFKAVLIFVVALTNNKWCKFDNSSIVRAVMVQLKNINPIMIYKTIYKMP